MAGSTVTPSKSNRRDPAEFLQPQQKEPSPSTGPAISSRFNRPELDALRFIAFAMVFCNHAFMPWNWFFPIRDIGGFGVSIFFCLSAYLIMTLLLREKDRTGTVRLRAFAMRRALRIWPLYFLMISVGFVAGMHWPAIRIRPVFVSALLLMFGNVYIARYGWVMSGCIAPLWSISIEEQFYIGAPLMVRLGGKRALWAICIVAMAASYIALGVLGHQAALPEKVWVNSFVQFQFFAAGGFIALLTYDRKILLPLYWRCAFAGVGLALFYIAAAVCLIHSTHLQPVMEFAGYLSGLLGTVAVFISILHLPARIPHKLRYLGKISYGLYVFHYPLIWFVFWSDGRLSPMRHSQQHPIVATILVLFATIIVATISYEFFEKPILRRKQRFETEKTRV